MTEKVKVHFKYCLSVGPQILDWASLEVTSSPWVRRAKPFPRVWCWSPAFEKMRKGGRFFFQKGSLKVWNQGASYMCSLLEFRALTYMGHIRSVLCLTEIIHQNILKACFAGGFGHFVLLHMFFGGQFHFL